MVANDSAQSPKEEVEMKFETDVISTENGSGNGKTECPHCSYRCTSPSVLARHSWEEHPLLMRRKKHLITPRRTDDVKCENNNDSDHPAGAFPLFGKNGQPSTQARDPPVLQAAIKMKECSITSGDRETDEVTTVREDETSKQFQPVTTHTTGDANDGSFKQSRPMGSSWGCTQKPSTQQRHVAVVKPVPAENKNRGSMQQEQSIKFLTQSVLRDQLVYAPMYSVFLPALNQFVTIPIPIGTGVVPSAIPNPTLGQNLENAMKFITSQQRNNIQANSTQDQAFRGHIPTLPPSQQPQNLIRTAKDVSNDFHGKPKVAISPQRATQTTNTQHYPQKTVETLLRKDSQSVCEVMQSFYQQQSPDSGIYTAKSERSSGDREPFPSAKATKDSQPDIKYHRESLIGEERLQALEKALKKTDCCDINDNSSTTPFKCPDGVWRMVKFKCIRGIWLVQMPGFSTPTAYVPCDPNDVPKLNDDTCNGAFILSDNTLKRRRRRSSEPTNGETCAISAKRLCASAPIPCTQSEPNLPKIESMKRTLSTPLVTQGFQSSCRHFTSREGKKVNISMIRRSPAPSSTSSSLIKSLLLQKPGGFRDLIQPAPLSSDSMAY